MKGADATTCLVQIIPHTNGAVFVAHTEDLQAAYYIKLVMFTFRLGPL